MSPEDIEDANDATRVQINNLPAKDMPYQYHLLHKGQIVQNGERFLYKYQHMQIPE